MAFWDCVGYFLLQINLIATFDEKRGRQWTAEEAQVWRATHSWRMGTNYLPSTSANVLDMFEPSTFEFTLLKVESEARLAQTLGFTTFRIFLHEQLYFFRGEEFLRDVSRLLDILSRHDISAMIVLFDAVWRPDAERANPIPGVHNSAWVQSPTHEVLREFAVGDPSAQERLQKYVTGVVAYLGDDSRVICWDIYNEASMTHTEHWILPRLLEVNGWTKAPTHWFFDEEKQVATLNLLLQAFTWARSVRPTQPLTSGIWSFPDDVNAADVTALHFRALLTLSDIISLHCYCEPDTLELRLDELSAFGRPLIVTEFMARTSNSRVETSLPILQKHGAWGYIWGFVRGPSQTHLSWSSWAKVASNEEEWFHDLLFENGTAYSVEEAKTIWWYTIGQALKL